MCTKVVGDIVAEISYLSVHSCGRTAWKWLAKKMGKGTPTVLDGGENLNDMGCKVIGVLKACSWGRCPLPSLKLLGSPRILVTSWHASGCIPPAWGDPRLPLLVKVRCRPRAEIPQQSEPGLPLWS